MRAALEVHAARMRLRAADDKFEELSRLPTRTGDERNFRHAQFTEFWRNMEHDHLIVKESRRRRRKKL